MTDGQPKCLALAHALHAARPMKFELIKDNKIKQSLHHIETIADTNGKAEYCNEWSFWISSKWSIHLSTFNRPYEKLQLVSVTAKLSLYRCNPCRLNYRNSILQRVGVYNLMHYTQQKWPFQTL